MLELEDDGITTKKAFNFDVTIPLIKVKKTGYTDADTTAHTIIDGINTIAVNMPIKMVGIIANFRLLSLNNIIFYSSH